MRSTLALISHTASCHGISYRDDIALYVQKDARTLMPSISRSRAWAQALVALTVTLHERK